MKWIAALVFAGFLFATSKPAAGFLMFNTDVDTYRIEVVGSDGNAECFDIAGGEAVELTCENGCSISVADGHEFMLTDADELVISDGQVFLVEEFQEEEVAEGPR